MAARVDVAVGVLRERQAGRWRVLIARRPHEGILGGYWEFPGGKVEPGESHEQCLVREFEEELGLTVAVEQELAPIEHAYDHGRVRLFPFFCCRTVGEEPQALAAIEVRWVEAATLTDYRFPSANETLLRQVIAELEDAQPRV